MQDYESALETFLKAKGEFEAVLAANPGNVYAVRMSSYNLDRLGKSYAALAEKRDRQECLQNALGSWRAALENFRKLKAGGNLGEVDAEIIGETEREIEKIDFKL